MGDDDGDEEDAAFFRDHLSSRDLSATLVGLNSARFTACLSSVSLITGAFFAKVGDSPDPCMSVCVFLNSTPLGPGGVVHSPRLSKKAAFSLTEPDQNALRLVSGGASFCSLASLSPLPEAKAEAEPTADEAAGAEVCAEGVGLSCWADWRPRLLQEDCCWPEER